MSLMCSSIKLINNRPPVTELARDCEFAGNDAIVAFARAYSTNVVIHQHNAPRLEVLSQQHGGSLSQQCRGCPRTLHIAYLNGEHYCSVETMLPSEDLPAATQIPPVRVSYQYNYIHTRAHMQRIIHVPCRVLWLF